MAYAWVTITGKVFVPDEEVAAQVEMGCDLYGEQLTEGQEEKEAFASLAKVKLREDCFPTDEPFREEDIEIDFDTLKYSPPIL